LELLGSVCSKVSDPAVTTYDLPEIRIALNIVGYDSVLLLSVIVIIFNLQFYENTNKDLTNEEYALFNNGIYEAVLHNMISMWSVSHW
jgi:hypothetical protein